MKKLLSMAVLAAVATTTYAQVTPTGFFPTPAFWTEGFDTTAAGNYNTLPVFGPWALGSKIGANGALVVRPIPTPPSVPNVIYGDNVDMRITAAIPMKRFGGWFKSAPFGAIVTAVRFDFYDNAGSLIGSQSVPLGTTWQWIGFQTTPQWKRVEIFGNIPGFGGLVAMDSLRMRLW
jgi:hypothetical protein